MLAEQLELASTAMDECGSCVPSMSYEEGVHAALSWTLGHTDRPPMALPLSDVDIDDPL